MNVNFENTDTKRAIQSVHKGRGNGSMIVFPSDGKGKIENDTFCIEQVKQIMGFISDFDIVYDRGAYALDVDVDGGVYLNDERRKLESDSGISFPMIRKEYWERAFEPSTAGSGEKESIQQDLHGESQTTFEHVKVKVPPKPYEITKEERQSHEATHCPFCAWCEICVKAKSPDGKHAWLSQITRLQHTRLVVRKFQWWLRQIQFMDRFLLFIDGLGLVKAELNCDQEPSTLDVANALIKRGQSTVLRKGAWNVENERIW